MNTSSMAKTAASASERRPAADDSPRKRAVKAAQAADDASGPASVGQRIRSERERQRIGLRELARRVGVSASLISQIELGRATPSVATLYSIVNELNMSLDELFFEPSPSAAPARRGQRSEVSRLHEAMDSLDPSDASHPVPHFPEVENDRRSEGNLVVRREGRKIVQLEAGVTWERLTAANDLGADFLYVTYAVDGASAPAESLIRHAGYEYGYLIEGRLGVTVGFETHELRPGDSIAFASTTPHRLFNAGNTPANAIWFVLGREGLRITRGANTDEHR